MRNIKTGLVVLLVIFSSCNYLDIVPDDGAPTLDYAFRSEQEAKKFLFSCYSYMPAHGDPASNPALLSGDELWFHYPYGYLLTNPAHDMIGPYAWPIARGEQNSVSPLLNYWDGSNGGKNLFQGIRTCNTFLENIEKVPGMTSTEKSWWIGEADFLKAYYNFYLVKMYGPIPILDKNVPINTPPDKMEIARDPVDSCFNYIVRLLDTAAAYLPDQVEAPLIDKGRITRPIALAIKARVLATAASPLFNGNTDYVNFVNKDGKHLFNTTYDSQKWVKAADACKAAIDLCQQLGYQLYEFQSTPANYVLSDVTRRKMSIRNSVAEWFNSGIIWADRNSLSGRQAMYMPAITQGEKFLGLGDRMMASAPLKIAEMFYTKNGLPINEDKTWDYPDRFKLRTADSADEYNIYNGYQTAGLNFDREPRFYADLGFDGGMWFGQGVYNDNKEGHVEGKFGQYSSNQFSNVTGYFPKKMVSVENVFVAAGTPIRTNPYPWPIMKLDDLYLLYAEALNEAGGPGPDVYQYINLVRTRAGIPTVQDSWTNYSTDPSKYTTTTGMRDIIHRERLIELAFEGQRFWDLRRWKEAENYLNEPIKGWNIAQSGTAAYYTIITLFSQTFRKTDYLWPISDNDLTVDQKLVQNPGW